jgi:TusA-related sulfurtransferase
VAVASGKQKFADLARQLNTEPALKANGGDVGWKTAENASLGEKVVSDAVKTLKPGEMTQVITTDRGAYLVLAEASREKNLTYDQVKHEIAAELAREVWSKEAAKRAALQALETARGGKKLEDSYQREIKPGVDLQDLQRRINDPKTDPQIREILRQQLQQEIQKIQLQLGGEDHGSIVIESPDVLAASKADDGGSAGAAGGNAPAGSAAPAPAAGSAAPAPTAGSAAPAPAAGAPQAAPAAPLVPSSDTLPAFQDVTQPKIRRELSQPRQKRLPGVDADGVKALFDELEKGQLASRVYESEGNYTVVQLVEKAEAKVEEFDKEATRHIEQLREVRGAQLVHDWVKARCEELTKAGKIKPRSDKTAEFDDKGKPAPTVYSPCMTLR